MGDDEDGPPFERSALAAPVLVTRELDTQPEGLRPPPPVEVVDDKLTESDDENPFAANERASLQATLRELAGLRGALVENNRIGRSADRKLDRIIERLNEGSNFMSRLSLKQDMLEAKPNGLTGKRVLVVEDDGCLLELMDTLLCRLGCNVTGASTRDEAEKLLAATPRPFHVALIDARIPPVSGEGPHQSEGVELVRWMRARHPAVAVILTSADLSMPGLDSLPVARLAKPHTLERLNSALYSALGHKDVAADTERPPIAPDFPPLEFVTRPSPPESPPVTRPETPEALAHASEAPAASGTTATE